MTSVTHGNNYMKGALAASHMEILENFSLGTLAVFFFAMHNLYQVSPYGIWHWLKSMLLLAGDLIGKQGWSSYLYQERP